MLRTSPGTSPRVRAEASPGASPRVCAEAPPRMRQVLLVLRQSPLLLNPARPACTPRLVSNTGCSSLFRAQLPRSVIPGPRTAPRTASGSHSPDAAVFQGVHCFAVFLAQLFPGKCPVPFLIVIITHSAADPLLPAVTGPPCCSLVMALNVSSVSL